MKYLKTIILTALLVSYSCKTVKEIDKNKEIWINSYKKMFVVMCLQKSGIPLDKDNSSAILFEQLITEKETMKEIDSLANSVSVQIQNSPNYFEGKPIITKILDYYTSKELNEIATKRYNSN